MQHNRFIDSLFSRFELAQSAGFRYRFVFALLLASILTACADMSGSTLPVRTDSTDKLLSSWRSIESGVQESGSGTSAIGGYVQLGRPVSVAAWADYVYIADAGRQAILRYDLRREVFSIFYRLQVTTATRIIATAGEYLYVTDPAQSRILYLDRTGRLIREIKDFNLKQPVAIAEDFSRGRILVADGFYNQVLAFNKLGRLIRILHPVDITSAPISGLTAMVVKGEKIYFLDRSQQQIVVTDLDGNHLRTIARNGLKQPVAMQVDDLGRIIVADAFDNSILFFSENREHKISAIKSSVMTMQLNDMDLHENWIYLVDVAAARVEVMKLHYPDDKAAAQK